MSLKKFTYKKEKDGSISNRVAYVLSPASDCDLCLDLTEFSPEEIRHYCEELARIHREYSAAIVALGLGSKYRKFKHEGILDN